MFTYQQAKNIQPFVKYKKWKLEFIRDLNSNESIKGFECVSAGCKASCDADLFYILSKDKNLS
jgi:hypothetical protein